MIKWIFILDNKFDLVILEEGDEATYFNAREQYALNGELYVFGMKQSDGKIKPIYMCIYNKFSKKVKVSWIVMNYLYPYYYEKDDTHKQFNLIERSIYTIPKKIECYLNHCEANPEYACRSVSYLIIKYYYDAYMKEYPKIKRLARKNKTAEPLTDTKFVLKNETAKPLTNKT